MQPPPLLGSDVPVPLDYDSEALSYGGVGAGSLLGDPGARLLHERNGQGELCRLVQRTVRQAQGGS